MNIKAFLEFHKLIEGLKHLKRTGWVIRGVPEPETVAAHSFRMALMVLTLKKELEKEYVDTNKLIKMVLYHDIGESLIGDILPEAITPKGFKKISAADKHRMELEAVAYLSSLIELPEMLELWQEIEEGKTIEAKIAKDIDLIDMALQALQYKQRYQGVKGLDQFLPGCYEKIQTTIGKQILSALKQQENLNA